MVQTTQFKRLLEQLKKTKTRQEIALRSTIEQIKEIDEWLVKRK